MLTFFFTSPYVAKEKARMREIHGGLPVSDGEHEHRGEADADRRPLQRAAAAP